MCAPNVEERKCGWKSDEDCNIPPSAGTCKLGCYCKSGYARINNVCKSRSDCVVVEDEDDDYNTKCVKECLRMRMSANCILGCYCKEDPTIFKNVCDVQTDCKSDNNCPENERYICSKGGLKNTNINNLQFSHYSG